MQQPKVSVIMPVYNAEPFLEQCLDSLLGQTMQDFELICVDDESTDRSVELLRQYASRDNRISVLEQVNQGGGAARNHGMRFAKGEYLLFLDSDDFFDPRLLELSVQRAAETEADIVLFDAWRYDSRTGKTFPNIAHLRQDLLPTPEVFSCVDCPDRIFQVVVPAPWVRLYRRSFVEQTGLRYQEIQNSNDYFFGVLTLALAQRITAVREKLVYYRINNAQSTQGSKEKNPLQVFQPLQAIYEELNSRGLYETLRVSFLHAALSTCSFVLRSLKHTEARFQVLDYMESPAFQAMDMLGHDESWYGKPITYQYASMLQSAIAQYHRTRRALLPMQAGLVCPARESGPVSVSVVIPVYNTSFYLEDTLKSITQQSLRNIEIICVDDGSTDDSMARLLNWAKQDGRICVYHQENRGLSVSRNVGLAHAKGTYTYFMDSDDLLEPDALECLVATAEQDRLDIVFFNAVPFWDDLMPLSEDQHFTPIYQRQGNYEGVWDGRELFQAFYDRREDYPSVCIQFIRTDFLREIGVQFHPGILHEDRAYTFEVTLQAKRAGYLNRTFFHRRIRGNSIMTTPTSFQNVYGYYTAFLDMFQCFARLKNDLTPGQQRSAMSCLCMNLSHARNYYMDMPQEDRGGVYGLGDDYSLLNPISRDWNTAREQIGTAQKLREVLVGKKELNAKLKRIYEEKRKRDDRIKELNAKLKRTLQEKRERGDKIKELKRELSVALKQNKSLRGRLTTVTRSVSYRLGMALTAPIRMLLPKS